MQLHAGQQADPQQVHALYPFIKQHRINLKIVKHAANLFGLKEFGNIYTRIQNPTTDVFEQRIAALEGGVAALLCHPDKQHNL